MRFLLHALWAFLTGRETLPVPMLTGPAGLLHLRSGRFIPPLIGADDGDGDDDADAGDDDTDDADDDADDDGDDDTDAKDDDPEAGLPDNVKAILKKERDARRKAERKAREAVRKARQKTTDEKPADTKKDDGGPSGTDAITAKIQRANLKAALADEGITGRQAKAAMRLLDGIEYDADDEPINLEDVLEDAEEIYGTELIRGSSTTGDDTGDATSSKQRRAPNVNGGSGNRGAGKGPRLTADELQAAKDAGIKPEKYEALKGVKTLEEYQAAQAKLKATNSQ